MKEIICKIAKIRKISNYHQSERNDVQVRRAGKWEWEDKSICQYRLQTTAAHTQIFWK